MPDTNMLIREGMALSDVKLRPGEAGPSQGEKTGGVLPPGQAQAVQIQAEHPTPLPRRAEPVTHSQKYRGIERSSGRERSAGTRS